MSIKERVIKDLNSLNETDSYCSVGVIFDYKRNE